MNFIVVAANTSAGEIARTAREEMRGTMGQRIVTIVPSGTPTPGRELVLVHADDLADALAAGTPAAQVVVVNADRGDVLALLEQHALAGAIECDEAAHWRREGARLFARKDRIATASGETIGGDGRESERYVMWQPAGDLKMGAALELYRGTFAAPPAAVPPLRMSAAEAIQRGLPALGFTLTLDGTGMFPVAPPGNPRWYVQLNGPPGGPLLFIASAVDSGDLEQGIKAFLGDQRGARVDGATAEVRLAGRSCAARAVFVGEGHWRTAYAFAVIPHGHAHVLLAFGSMGGPPRVTSPSDVLAHPSLKIIAESLRLLDD